MFARHRRTNRALKTHWQRPSTYQPSLEALEDRTVPTTLTLKFNSLPSAQGWTYLTGSPPISETRAYSVDGTKLTQNTMGIGSNGANYLIYNAIDPTQPFTIDVRARVLQSEDTQPGGPVTAFFAGAFTGTELFGFFLNTSAIRAPAGTQEVRSIDATQFHDYRIEAKPGVNVSIYVDNVLFISEPPPQNNAPNQLELGDASSFENGLAEITSFTLTQGQADIAIVSAQLRNPTAVQFTYNTTGNPGPFQVGLYRSTDPAFDRTDVLLATQTVTPSPTNPQAPGSFKVQGSLINDPSLPYLLVVADPANQIAESNENNNVAVIVLPTVTLTSTSPRQVTLMQALSFRVDVIPTNAIISSFTIERTESSNTAWTVVSTSQTDNLTQRLAGFFEFRASATIEGIQFLSATLRPAFEVQFPSYADIVNNAGVQAAVNAAWANTLALTTPTARREEGFWIRLNTATGTYEFTQTSFGPVVGPTETGSVQIGPRPADVFAPDGEFAVYTVASFHTHTPMTYRTGKRPVGPSGQDDQFNVYWQVTGLVYDYVATLPGGFIPGGLPLDAPAQLYQSGLDRRPTPRR